MNPPFIDWGDKQIVLLAGSSRSGTTWVQQIINSHHDYRVIFEPFRADKVRCIPPLPHKHLYVRPNAEMPLFSQCVTRIVQGRLRSRWTDRGNRPKLYRRRLIKATRANLLLNWFSTQFPAVKIILLLRHPCAVSLSQIKIGWSQDVAPLRNLTEQPHLIADYLQPFMPLFRDASDPFEINILFWAVQNYVPLQQFFLERDSAEIHLLFYEKLCTDPTTELDHLCKFLNRPLTPTVMEAWRKPSTTTAKWSAIVSGASLIDAWRDELTTTQINRAVQLLKHFGLDQLYDEAAMPHW